MTSSLHAVQQQDWESLAPSEDARDLAQVARQHFTALDSIESTRRLTAGEQIDKDLWPALVESGYTQIALPESAGGVGDPVDLAVLLEEAGRALVSAPLLTTASGAQLLLGSGLDADRFAQNAGSFGAATGHVIDDAVYCDSVPVTHGNLATSLSLMIDDGSDIHVVEVDTSGPDIKVTPVAHNLDPSRPIATVTLSGTAALQHRTQPRTRYHEVSSPARMCISADLVGVANGALDRALRHVVDRRQFGKPLGSFQAVKHQLADAYVQVERARSLVLGTAVALRRGEPDRRAAQLSLLALGASIDAAVSVSSRCVQLLGAMGVTFEADAHLFLRRAHQTALTLESASAAYRAAAEFERSTHV